MPITSFIAGPSIPTVAADGGNGGRIWTNVNNSKVEDGAVASALNIGPGGGATYPNQLLVTSFGFAIPSKAVIDGIKLEIKAQSDMYANPSVFLTTTAVITAASTVSNPPWLPSLEWITYGGATDTWGRTWAPAEINAAAFGASLSAMPQTGAWNASVDAVRITVYWHYSADVSPADVPKKHLYKVFRGSQYLGNLPNVLTPFGFALDINSVGTAINIECGVSTDTAALPGNRLVTEAGEPITDEAGNYLYTEGQAPIVGLGNSVDPYIIQNGNKIEVWEYSYYYPNGKIMFKGQVNRIEAGFGEAAANKIKLLVLSNGLDLDNYIARGAPFAYTLDQSQTSQNTYAVVSTPSMGAGWTKYGQTWVPGAGVTRLGAISLMLQGAADVTVTVYSSVNGAEVASVTQRVDTAGAAAVVQFGLASLLTVSPGSTYLFGVGVAAGQSINVYCTNANPYANGAMYGSSYGGGSGGGSWGIYSTGAYDLYFLTYSGLPTTTATYTLKDPSTEMLKPIIDDYRIRGGQLNYASGSVDTTGLSLTVTFNTETILDALKRVLSVAPSGYYFYVDPATDTIYFKNTLSTATHKLIKGRHLNKIDLVLSIENVKNDLLESGATIAGTNLYTEYADQTSKSLYGQRLARQSDNRISSQPTLDAVGNSFIAENKDEYYETPVTVLDRTMDITLLKPGQTIGLRGFGSFIDRLTLQIVRVEYLPGGHAARLTIGNMPKRFSTEFEKLIRGLLAEQTVANPSAPS